MRLTPIIALVPDEAMSKLLPLVEQLASEWRATMVSSNVLDTMRANGWTPDAIAWGLLVAATADLDWSVRP